MDSLLSKILIFRLKQLWRLFKQVGFIRIFILAIIIVGFLIFELPGLISDNYFLSVLIYPLVILPIHLLRKDQGFLRKLDVSIEAILAGEYHSLVLPYSLFLVYFQQWSAILFGHLLITIMLFLPSVKIEKSYQDNSRLIKWIPVNLFEWRSYMRQRKLFLLFGFTFTVLVISYAIAIPVAILILVASFSEAFTDLECKELIESYPRNSSFLWAKLKDHSVFIHLFFLPFYTLFLLFHIELWYILILLLIIIECSICFCLLYKYSQFGFSKSVIHNQIPFTIFFISTIIFFPIGIVFLYFYWRKANKALPEYAKN
ncbi:hypothetical protein CK503_00205 [Aliifodinibius salipaludis]|uniref:Uncharacterized protein n=1 Tax=Fodinibius salipaludis TaxID=2032627 RepID=A0A2A2GFH1_9BACT|nr:hypothetical protein CK503_00205 [Aliifodinibius salipaludis]